MPDLLDPEYAKLPAPGQEALAVTICATKGYQYAMIPQARAIHANLRHLTHPIFIILIGDEGLKTIEEAYKALFFHRTNVRIERRAGFAGKEGDLNYKNSAQLLIAQMRTAAFVQARALGATLCWSFDSDVIPKTSSCYRTLRWLLEIPGSFYQVAIAPYPSQGGGDFLAGRGTPEHPILQDFQPEERTVPEELQKKIEANRVAAAAIEPGKQPPRELLQAASDLYKEIEKCPPKGNVFKMNAEHGWKPRGWLSQAYPALGRGAIVPTDWCGFGCTLLNRQALDEADFLGYEGSGTEDLFAVWHRWHQVGIRIGAVLHEPAFHVSRRKDGRQFLSFVRWVTDADEGKGGCVGHLRTEQRPFYVHEKGEVWDPVNDGNPVAPDDRPKPAPEPAPAAAVPSPAPAVSPEPAIVSPAAPIVPGSPVQLNTLRRRGRASRTSCRSRKPLPHRQRRLLQLLELPKVPEDLRRPPGRPSTPGAANKKPGPDLSGPGQSFRVSAPGCGPCPSGSS